MYLIEKLKYMRRSAKKSGKNYDILHSQKFFQDRILGEVLRNTHSIEKGLSIENVRLGYGYEKIVEAFHLIEEYQRNGGNMHAEPILMFEDSVAAYLRFHDSYNFTNDRVETIRDIHQKLIELTDLHSTEYGGVLKVKASRYDQAEKEIMEKVFRDRHSVREFAHTEIDENDLHAAVELAFRCPSACNRQCYRVHIIPKENFSQLEGWFQGVGGFADDLEKMIIITGKISMYRPSEEMQHVVSGVVYASYLTMALQVYGIGCCFLQRNIFPNPEWTTIAKRLDIPEDELAVCALGIGNYKDEYKVPLSYRLKYETIVTEH